jgi:hypothetical protein
LLTAMARDLVPRQGVGEGAAEVWRGLVQRSARAESAPVVAVESTVSAPEPVEANVWIQPSGPMVQLSLF